jgi:hypothetical protein
MLPAAMAKRFSKALDLHNAPPPVLPHADGTQREEREAGRHARGLGDGGGAGLNVAVDHAVVGTDDVCAGFLDELDGFQFAIGAEGDLDSQPAVVKVATVGVPETNVAGDAITGAEARDEISQSLRPPRHLIYSRVDGQGVATKINAFHKRGGVEFGNLAGTVGPNRVRALGENMKSSRIRIHGRVAVPLKRELRIPNSNRKGKDVRRRAVGYQRETAYAANAGEVDDLRRGRGRKRGAAQRRIRAKPLVESSAWRTGEGG